MRDDLPVLDVSAHREEKGGRRRWIELTDGSRAEDADFALPHEITGSVARHYVSAGCWLVAGGGTEVLMTERRDGDRRREVGE